MSQQRPPSLRPPALDIEPERLQHVRDCIEDIRLGKMVILTDDEDRENEGDLVFAAQHCTPEKINFMAKWGRGLICLTMTERQVERLELPMMTLPRWRGGPPLGTAFTLSIEASHGVSTGISAADRSHTILTAIRSEATPIDIVTPGHVFPLKAREGGVLVRAGQTEGSVDLSRLAGCDPSGVICEIMNDDGTMARMPDLEKFGAEHGIRILTIEDLIKYRLQTERLVRSIKSEQLVLDETGATWTAHVFDVGVEDREFLALVHGDPKSADSALCRVHAGSTIADAFASATHDSRAHLRRAIRAIEANGSGVIVYIPAQLSLKDELGALAAAAGKTKGENSLAGTLREFGLGAQVLRALGLCNIRLITNNPRKIAGIHGFGLELIETVPLAD